MSTTEKAKVILPSSPEAAQHRTDISGWVSRDGRYYGNDERSARYAGSTHSECEQCGATCGKGYTKCDACREKAETDRFYALLSAPWDGKVMIFSDSRDEYFNSPQDAEESLQEGQTMADLRLLLCKPNYPRQIDVDHFADDLPEDGDEHSLPSELLVAMEAFNKVAAECPPLSWSPSKVRLLIESEHAA